MPLLNAVAKMPTVWLIRMTYRLFCAATLVDIEKKKYSTAMSVSYTHLDVYKRQRQAFAGDPVWMSTIDLAPQLQVNHSNLFSLGPLQFRTAAAGLQSYHELRFDAPGVCDHFIREIIIGPKSLVEIDDLYLFLHSCGFCAVDYEDTSFATLDINIRKSELTYR